MVIVKLSSECVYKLRYEYTTGSINLRKFKVVFVSLFVELVVGYKPYTLLIVNLYQYIKIFVVTFD